MSRFDIALFAIVMPLATVMLWGLSPWLSIGVAAFLSFLFWFDWYSRPGGGAAHRAYLRRIERKRKSAPPESAGGNKGGGA